MICILNCLMCGACNLCQQDWLLNLFLCTFNYINYYANKHYWYMKQEQKHLRLLWLFCAGLTFFWLMFSFLIFVTTIGSCKNCGQGCREIINLAFFLCRDSNNAVGILVKLKGRKWVSWWQYVDGRMYQIKKNVIALSSCKTKRNIYVLNVQIWCK